MANNATIHTISKTIIQWTQWLYNNMENNCPIVTWLVVGWWYTYASEKYEFVSSNDEIPYGKS